MTGKLKYLPKLVLLELEDIKSEHAIVKDCLAMEKLVEYARVGRQVERIMKLDFRYKPTRRLKRR